MNHNFPLILMKNNNSNLNLHKFNQAIEESDDDEDDEESANLQRENSFFFKRFSSNRKSISIFIVCRDNVSNERLNAERLHSLRKSLIVSIRSKVAPICPLIVTHSTTYDYEDSVIQFTLQFEPSLSVALPLRHRQVVVNSNFGRKEDEDDQDEEFACELWKNK